jgi:hypothetical protein
MAIIELGPLTQFLDDNEIKELMTALKKVGVSALPQHEDADRTDSETLDDDVWADFLDRLDAEDIGADMYLPVEFDGVITVGGFKVASVIALVDVLDDIKDDLDVEREVDDDDDDDDDDDEEEEEEAEEDDDEDEDWRLREKLLKQVWKSLRTGAKTAVKREISLCIKTG